MTEIEEKVARINQLAKKSRETELTAEEKQEQAELRQWYIKLWRESMQRTLDNTYVMSEDGTKQKLKKKSEVTKS